MYADNLCVMVSTAIAPKKTLDACFEYGETNNLIYWYNPLKSVCMVFTPGRFKRYIVVAIGDEYFRYLDVFKILYLVKIKRMVPIC